MPNGALLDDRSPELEPIFVTPLEAAHLLGLSRTEVYRLLNEGVIESRDHGTRRLVSLESLKAFAESLPKR